MFKQPIPFMSMPEFNPHAYKEGSKYGWMATFTLNKSKGLFYRLKVFQQALVSHSLEM